MKLTCVRVIIVLIRWWKYGTKTHFYPLFVDSGGGLYSV